jgi:hypothetical protein
MRITVYDVLSCLASGMTDEQVLAHFPYLTREDILACLSYAAEREHRMLESIELLNDARTAVQQIESGEAVSNRDAKAELRRR